MKVRFTQDVTGETRIITINQPAQNHVIPGNCTYYQWGRKDPFIGVDFSGKTPVDKKHYPESNTIGKGSWTSQISIGTSIQNPHLFYAGGKSDWCKNHYYNLWSANIGGYYESDEVVVKTVYDPSPVGYCMPANSAFTGFKFDNTYGEEDFSKYNTPYKSREEYDGNHGWEFYCNRMPAVGEHDSSGGTVFFPACERRWWSTYVVTLTPGIISGGYWLAGLGRNQYITSPAANAGAFTFSTSITTYDIGTRTYGMAVRPVREK